jgi:hypothetical protein
VVGLVNQSMGGKGGGPAHPLVGTATGTTTRVIAASAGMTPAVIFSTFTCCAPGPIGRRLRCRLGPWLT